ncbi:unnamed protein product, partial [marine sediment metagenome]
DAGITPLMNLILFYPTTTIEDITETIENTIELVNYGSRLTVYPFIEFYAGASMLEKESFNFIYEKFNINGKNLKLPSLILPHSDKIRELATKSVKLRKELLDKILKKYNWTGIVPHPLYGLILFLAVYKILNLKTDKIENSIDKILMKESEESKQEINNTIKIKGAVSNGRS